MLLSILLDQISNDITQVLRRTKKSSMDKSEIEDTAAFYAGGLTNALFQHLKHDMPIDEERFLEILSHFLIL